MTLKLPANIRLDGMTNADFETVAQLGEMIWRSHYTSIISREQIDYMLSDRYTPDNLLPYLNASNRWLLLLRIADQAVGYFSHAFTNKPGEIKVEQLYLLPEFQGRGLGSLMLRHIEDEARARNVGTLILQVNKLNAGAIAFYRKAGFIVREEAVFYIGNGFVMDDYVMEKSL